MPREPPVIKRALCLRSPIIGSRSTSSQIRCSMQRCSSCARSVRFVGMTTETSASALSCAAVARAERQNFDALRARRFGGPQHVRRVAARRVDDQQILRAGQRLDLPREDVLESEVVRRRGEQRRVRRQRDRRDTPAGCACSGRRTRSPDAARPPRCRRCRRRTACRRARPSSRTNASRCVELGAERVADVLRERGEIAECRRRMLLFERRRVSEVRSLRSGVRITRGGEPGHRVVGARGQPTPDSLAAASNA